MAVVHGIGGFFMVTFCIVAFQGFYMNDRDVVILAGSRVAAICVGVVFALLLACTIFPTSASGKVRPAA
jgi:Aluminium activated malate transporter